MEFEELAYAEEPFNVINHTAGSLNPIMTANYVLAFCGSDMYVIKSRSPEYKSSTVVPRRPDLVIGVYPFPKPHVEVIRMHGDPPTK